jgi:hypothetical protein
MNIQRNNAEERQQRVDAILVRLRIAPDPSPARIRRVTQNLGGPVAGFTSIPISGRHVQT